LFLAGSACAYACTRYVLSPSVQPSGVLYHWKLLWRSFLTKR
jgi:DHA1 family bicyclomycin/chloramphenicol resistance-like MFS transporter